MCENGCDHDGDGDESAVQIDYREWLESDALTLEGWQSCRRCRSGGRHHQRSIDYEFMIFIVNSSRLIS